MIAESHQAIACIALIRTKEVKGVDKPIDTERK